MPVELTKALVMQGREATKVVPVTGYDAEVTIRSLTDLELADVLGIAKKNDWLAIFEQVTKKKPTDEKELKDISVISGAIPLMIEICIRGAVMWDREKVPAVELLREEKRPIFEAIGRFATITIGIEILMTTLEPLEKIEGFMKPPKPNSSKS